MQSGKQKLGKLGGALASEFMYFGYLSQRELFLLATRAPLSLAN